MALTSVFYDGPVTETDRAKNRGGVPDYGVYGASDFQVTTNGSVPYSVLVRAGRAHGWGITDTAATNQTLTFDAPAAGVTRWDLVAVRRNWQPLLGGPSTLVVVKGGATTVIPAGRKVGPGVEDDQPLALVCWKGGQSAPYQIIDLRCWAHNGGLEVANEIAFEYLERPGACIRLDGLEWRFARKANGTWDWATDPNATQTDPGLMSPADKKKLDGATWESIANSIMWRGSTNHTQIGTMNLTLPQSTSILAATRKDYVDAVISAARTYAASQATAALNSARTYAASQATAALNSARTYAASVAASARSAAEAYARSLTSDMRPAASGKRAIGSISAGGSATNQTVSFPSGRFSAVPNVSVTGGSSRHSIGIQSVTTSGFTFTCSNWSTNLANPDDIYWVAVQN